MFKTKRKKSELNSFVKHFKKAGIHIELFKKHKIKKYFNEKPPEVLVNLANFIRGIAFDKFSITFQEKKEMSWYSENSGRIVLDLALLDPKNQAHKEIVQRIAQRAREIESILAEPKLE